MKKTETRNRFRHFISMVLMIVLTISFNAIPVMAEETNEKYIVRTVYSNSIASFHDSDTVAVTNDFFEAIDNAKVYNQSYVFERNNNQLKLIFSKEKDYPCCHIYSAFNYVSSVKEGFGTECYTAAINEAKRLEKTGMKHLMVLDHNGLIIYNSYKVFDTTLTTEQLVGRAKAEAGAGGYFDVCNKEQYNGATGFTVTANLKDVRYNDGYQHKNPLYVLGIVDSSNYAARYEICITFDKTSNGWIIFYGYNYYNNDAQPWTDSNGVIKNKLASALKDSEGYYGDRNLKINAKVTFNTAGQQVISVQIYDADTLKLISQKDLDLNMDVKGKGLVRMNPNKLYFYRMISLVPVKENIQTIEKGFTPNFSDGGYFKNAQWSNCMLMTPDNKLIKWINEYAVAGGSYYIDVIEQSNTSEKVSISYGGRDSSGKLLFVKPQENIPNPGVEPPSYGPGMEPQYFDSTSLNQEPTPIGPR